MGAGMPASRGARKAVAWGTISCNAVDHGDLVIRHARALNQALGVLGLVGIAERAGKQH